MVLHDQTLTPLFTYVAILNALVGLRAPVRRDVGRRHPATSRSAPTAPCSRRCVLRRHGGARPQRRPPRRSAWRPRTNSAPSCPNGSTSSSRVSEQSRRARRSNASGSTPCAPEAGRDAHAAGAAARLSRRHRNRRDARHDAAHASGPITLLVSDAATLTSLEQRELKPGKPDQLAGPARADERERTQQPALRAAAHLERRHGRRRRDASGACRPRSGRSLDEDKTVPPHRSRKSSSAPGSTA